MRCRGKYIIALEGDDFWTDPNKINRQINFLEAHPEYIAVSHHCTVVGDDSLPNGETYPECHEEEYTFRHYFSEIMPGQMATLMHRNPALEPQQHSVQLKTGLAPGDRLAYFILLMNGKIHCIQENMSAYRHITTHGSSYSATYQYHFSHFEQLYYALLQYAQTLGHAEAARVAQGLYFRHLLVGIKRKQCNVSYVLRCMNGLDGKLRMILEYCIYIIRKNVFHSKLWI